jgi:F1F0 ATPase subunit 2
MTSILVLAAAGLAGFLLGLGFFGGLWWTVRRIPVSRHPGVLIMISLLLRMSVVLACFYLILQLHWQALLAALVGFTLARIGLKQRLGRHGDPASADPEGAS